MVPHADCTLTKEGRGKFMGEHHTLGVSEFVMRDVIAKELSFSVESRKLKADGEDMFKAFAIGAVFGLLIGLIL